MDSKLIEILNETPLFQLPKWERVKTMIMPGTGEAEKWVKGFSDNLVGSETPSKLVQPF